MRQSLFFFAWRARRFLQSTLVGRIILTLAKGRLVLLKTSGVDRFKNDIWDHIEQLCFDCFAELAKLAGEEIRADGRTMITVDKGVAQVARFDSRPDSSKRSPKRLRGLLTMKT